MDAKQISDCVIENIKNSVQTTLPDNFLTQNFPDLDIDSLSTLEIIVGCMKNLNIKIPRDQFRNIKTPQDLIEHLSKFKS